MKSSKGSAPPGPPHSSFTETEGEVSMFVVAILRVHDYEQCWSVFIDLCLTNWTADVVLFFQLSDVGIIAGH